MARRGERLGDRVDERPLAGRHALVDERREAADEVDADLLHGLVERLREGDRGVAVPGVALEEDRGGRDGEALVDDLDAVARGDGVRGRDEPPGGAADAVADGVAHPGGILGRAGVEVHADRDRAHVEVLLADHAQRGGQVGGFKHCGGSPSWRG